MLDKLCIYKVVFLSLKTFQKCWQLCHRQFNNTIVLPILLLLFKNTVMLRFLLKININIVITIKYLPTDIQSDKSVT